MKKPRDKAKVCPHFGRQVQSYRFNGIVCNAQSVPHTLGENWRDGWSEEQRDTKLQTHCFGNFTECPTYKFVAEKNQRKE